MVLIPLCAFCGTPFWTLLLRHEIGGMVFAAFAPVVLVLANVFVLDRLGDSGSRSFWPTGPVLLLIYCALAYLLGRARFTRLQVLDGPSQELNLPVGLEARLMRPLTIVASRFRGPFAVLVKKELRLQQISFLLAGVFVVIAVASACALRLQQLQEPLTLQPTNRWPAYVLGADFAVFMLILPLIAGAMAVAEERGWELAEWHLTLPPSAFKQWSAKMLAALSTSVVLGLVLPAILYVAGTAFLGYGRPTISLEAAPILLCWVLGQLLLTSVAVYAASFSNTTLRAILGASAIIAFGGLVCAAVGDYATIVIAPRLMELSRLARHTPYDIGVLNTLMPLLLAWDLLAMLCLVQGLAWSNFRSARSSVRRVVVQLLAIFSAVAFIVLVTSIVIIVLASRH